MVMIVNSGTKKLMQAFFSPAVALMSRLDITRKFMLLGLMSLVAIAVVIGVLVTLVAVLFQWLPTSASEEFDRIQDIYWFATIISIGIFSLVAAVVVYSVWKWRVPVDDEGRSEEPSSSTIGLSSGRALWLQRQPAAQSGQERDGGVK